MQQIEQLVADGRAPAAFICESVYGNAGGMALPDGYLQQVYAAVRAAGGLAISDEVQVGYGRLGEWFWGFHAAGRGARHRVDRQVDGQRLSPWRRDHQPRGRRRVPVAGLLLLVDRRQSAVVRDRHHRPRCAA